jgi:hypothetical protein
VVPCPPPLPSFSLIDPAPPPSSASYLIPKICLSSYQSSSSVPIEDDVALPSIRHSGSGPPTICKEEVVPLLSPTAFDGRGRLSDGEASSLLPLAEGGTGPPSPLLDPASKGPVLVRKAAAPAWRELAPSRWSLSASHSRDPSMLVWSPMALSHRTKVRFRLSLTIVSFCARLPPSDVGRLCHGLWLVKSIHVDPC